MATTDPAPLTERDWTLPELRRAITLAYGTTRTGHPNVTPIGRQLNVSPRSVQRWLAGTATPKPHRLAQLRQALLPDSLILAQQADGHRWAQEAAAAMAVPRGRGLDPQWVAQHWHKPHRLLVLSNPAGGISRPVIELVNRAKPPPTQRHWTREDVVELPHRPAALLVRGLLLDAVAPWRIRVHHSYTTGHTLCWLSHAPTPLLTALAHQGGWR